MVRGVSCKVQKGERGEKEGVLIVIIYLEQQGYH